MAPSRRKGAGKSAAATAAAARRQWKVGDLVLAKVKGFPAWPATVSEPEKWGYSNDWKKVLVYFFGTKQIAFCNPADVEAFTEEKKKTLLVKRQGKGADFVRAVQEIIDCYEKSKKQDQDDEVNSGDEGTVSNAGNLEDDVSKSTEKVQTQICVQISNSRLDSLSASADKSESHSLVEVGTAAVGADLLGMERVSKERVDHALPLDLLKEATSIASNCLRKTSREELQNSVLQRTVPVRRSRSAPRADSSSKFENIALPLDGSNKVTGDVCPTVLPDESTYKRRRIRKSSGSSHYLNVESDGCSPALVSNGSSGDNCSEIVATNSESLNLNDGSSLESSCKTERPDVIEYIDRSVQHSEDLHLEAKSVVLKKKRKPNRKRLAPDAAAIVSPGKESVLEVPDGKTTTNSPNACELIHEQISKADGDEHLPLVKRARVRMGKLNTEEKELNDLRCPEGKSLKETLGNHSEPDILSCGEANNFLTERASSLEVKGAADGSSRPNSCTRGLESEPQLWRTKQYQMRCSVDGEAALPPSKRLHRALEAMSANTAEDGQAHIEVKGDKESMSSNGHCDSSEQNASSHIAIDEKGGNALEVQVVKPTSGDDSYMVGACGSLQRLTSPTLEIPTKASLEMKPCSQFLDSSTISKHGASKQTSVVPDNAMDLNIEESSVSTLLGKNEISVECLRHSSNVHEISPIVHEMHGGLESSRGSMDTSLPSMKEDDFRGPSNVSSNAFVEEVSAHAQVDRSDREDSMSLPIHQTPDSAAKVTEAKSSPPAFEGTRSTLSQLDENADGMGDSVKEVQSKLAMEDMDAPSNATSVKVLVAAAQTTRHLSGSNDVPGTASENKVSDAVPSPLCCRMDSCEKRLSPNPVISREFNVGNRNYLRHNRSESLDGCPHHKQENGETMEPSVSHRQNSLGRWSEAEANAAKKSFETMLGTLSRTKESIGRATRLALDCAKYGMASEVVEILAWNLESESSLHRRVDLFFLVDSITQCSRSQKGEIGDMYCSAVQAVLPRLLSAAAPPGNAARENRRQCLKVLRLWLERRTLSEHIIRHHMRELDSVTDASFTSAYTRRPSRTERALNDPIREMEGMLVDEYGSNESIKLPGFFKPRVLEDEEGSDADEKGFEAVTPERDPEMPIEQEAACPAPIERHRHILEDVDGELEMEDVAPSCEVVMTSAYHASGVDTAHPSNSDIEQQHHSFPFGPPLPENCPPSPPPLPTSPPPMAPPPPISAISLPFTDNAHSSSYMGTDESFPNHLQQNISQQPGLPSASSGSTSEAHYAPGYRDFTRQMQRPCTSSTVSPSCRDSGTHPFMRTRSNVQEMDHAPFHSKGYRLQPPPSTISNQFSYVLADQRVQSWTDSSSSSFDKRFRFEPNVHGENLNDNFAPDEVGERCRVSGPIHSGLQSDNPEAYAPVPQFGLSLESSRMIHRGWSFPPRMLSYRHPTPRRTLESTVSGANQAPSFWRPR